MNLKKMAALTATAVFVGALPIVSYAANSTGGANRSSAADTANMIITQTSQVAIASGTFVAAERPTVGTARIVQEGGHRYLELDAAFSTSDLGPDLHVLLDTTNTPPGNYADQGRAINLGRLISYSGAQRYPIPDAINLRNYQSVVIWCRMANATFGYAPLQATSRASIQ